jgi:uridine phosphorylase
MLRLFRYCVIGYHPPSVCHNDTGLVVVSVCSCNHDGAHPYFFRSNFPLTSALTLHVPCCNFSLSQILLGFVGVSLSTHSFYSTGYIRCFDMFDLSTNVIDNLICQ